MTFRVSEGAGMTGHLHRWTFFDASETGSTPEARNVRLPPRRVCLTCGITQVLVENLFDYPHVLAEMIRSPHKIISVNAA